MPFLTTGSTGLNGFRSVAPGSSTFIRRCVLASPISEANITRPPGNTRLYWPIAALFDCATKLIVFPFASSIFHVFGKCGPPYFASYTNSPGNFKRFFGLI